MERHTAWTMNRRGFLGAVGAAVVPAWSVAAAIERVGVQLYTVREALAADFDGTLAKVAAIGFKEVEFAGYAGRTPVQVQASLERHGLTAPAAHVDYPSLGEKWPQVIEAAGKIGHRYLVNPWIDESIRRAPDSWKRIAESFNRAGEASRKAGIQFAYHNHHFEFDPVDGVLPFDVLLQECDPGLVKIELDLCWIAVAGGDPLAYFSRHPGRFPLVHVKGLAKRPAGGAAAPIDRVLPDITDVGRGDVIDWPQIFAKAPQAGIQHYFVEHDVPKAPFESLKISYDYLRGLGF
ncbi:MAG TPA: sugar phosphate isomerase/epimerase [Vicinamibacterales bacterium]|nr:sugar phosphate isomerase/epimerase [Vicinamibacterales bacterium]